MDKKPKIKLFGVEINEDEEQDEEYVPTQQEEIQYTNDMKRKYKKNTQKRNIEYIQKIWEEMKSQSDQRKQQTENPLSALEIAREVLASQRKEQFQRVVFAGKEFLVNIKGEVIEQENLNELKLQDKKTEAKSKQIQTLTVEELRESFKSYQEILRKINSRAKNLDWNEYKVKQNIEQQLDKNRKSGGVLEKMNFLAKSKEHETIKKKLKIQ